MVDVGEDSDAGNTEVDTSVGEVEEVVRKRKRRAPNMKDDEEVVFLEAVKKVEAERIRVEEKKLALARFQFEEDCEGRQIAREERPEERQAAADLELRKMRLMPYIVLGREGGGGVASDTEALGPQ